MNNGECPNELLSSSRPELLSTSNRRLYTQQSVSDSQITDCDIEEFRREIQKKFLKSVANKIYSFPLAIPEGSCFFSDSDQDGLEDVIEYDLNQQNEKKKVKWHLPAKKERFFKKKRELEDSSNLQKKKIRERSQQNKRKYADLLKIIQKPGRTASSLNNKNGKNSSIKHSSILKSKELSQPLRSEQQVQTKPLVHKINRLRTQPDQSLVSTRRVNIGVKFKIS